MGHGPELYITRRLNILAEIAYPAALDRECFHEAPNHLGHYREVEES